MVDALNTEDALKGLEDIPWWKLLAVYGMAQGIPGTIRTLATSTSETARNTAAKLLLTELEHQDSVTQATPFAVPFLVALLRVPDAHARASILSLLSTYFCAAECALEHEDLGPGNPPIAQGFRADRATLWEGAVDDEDAHDHARFSSEGLWSWDYLVFTDIMCAAPILEELANDPQQSISERARELLARIQERDAT